MSQRATSTSVGSNSDILPGPIRDGHCPTPKEIMVLESRKVFDFCFQEDTIERCFFVAGLTGNSFVKNCEITNTTCEEISPRQFIPDQRGRALVSLRIRATLSITIAPDNGREPFTITRTITFSKRVVLCAPTGTDVTCHVTGTCICTVQTDAGLNEPNVCCTIQICVVVQSSTPVKVLVPTFGVVVPAECQIGPAVGGCPPLPPEGCNDRLGITVCECTEISPRT